MKEKKGNTSWQSHAKHLGSAKCAQNQHKVGYSEVLRQEESILVLQNTVANRKCGLSNHM